MHHLLVRWIICWCDLNKITYGLDDDEGYSITSIICWCERSIMCWCDLNQGPRSHSKCLSARISERILSSVSALKSWRQEKYNDGMKGLCNSHLVTTWSSAQDLIRSHCADLWLPCPNLIDDWWLMNRKIVRNPRIRYRRIGTKSHS